MKWVSNSDNITYWHLLCLNSLAYQKHYRRQCTCIKPTADGLAFLQSGWHHQKTTGKQKQQQRQGEELIITASRCYAFHIMQHLSQQAAVEGLSRSPCCVRWRLQQRLLRSRPIYRNWIYRDCWISLTNSALIWTSSSSNDLWIGSSVPTCQSTSSSLVQRVPQGNSPSMYYCDHCSVQCSPLLVIKSSNWN